MFLLFAFDRVHQLVDFLQLHDAHVRVPLRAFQTGVAEHGIRWMKRMSAPFSTSINLTTWPFSKLHGRLPVSLLDDNILILVDIKSKLDNFRFRFSLFM